MSAEDVHIIIEDDRPSKLAFTTWNFGGDNGLYDTQLKQSSFAGRTEKEYAMSTWQDSLLKSDDMNGRSDSAKKNFVFVVYEVPLGPQLHA